MTEDEFKSGEKKIDDKPKAKVKSGNVALKDHVLFCPPHIDPAIEIKKGDSLDKIPEKFYESLVTEGVMKGK